MTITLYSTNCPRCKVLEAKLAQKDIQYTLCTDVSIMQSKGFTEAPVLEVDDKILSFAEAIRFVNDWTNQ